MNFLKRTFLFALTVTILSACGGSDDPAPTPEPTLKKDTTDPTVAIASPSADAQWDFEKNQTLEFTLTDPDNASDTEEAKLKNYSVSIEYKAAIPATASTKSIKVVEPDPVAWSYTDSGTLDVKTKTITINDINIPAKKDIGETNDVPTMEGIYTITITVEDAAGNTTTKELDIQILDLPEPQPEA